MSKPFLTREERLAKENKIIESVSKALMDRLTLMVGSDPVLSKEVEVIYETEGHGYLPVFKIEWKKGRIKDEDSMWSTLCTARWKRTYYSSYSSGEAKLLVSQTGWDANRIGHATYKIRKDGTLNIESITDRMRDMVWQSIEKRNYKRKSRKQDAKILGKIRDLHSDFTFNGKPCVFNKGREFEVGQSYGNNINVRSNGDGDLSLTLKLRDVHPDKVRDLMKLLEEHIANEDDGE